MFPNKTIGYKIREEKRLWRRVASQNTKRVLWRGPGVERSFGLFPGAIGFGDRLSHSESEEMEAVIQNKTGKTFEKAPAWEKERGSRVRLPSKQRHMPSDLVPLREGWLSSEGLAISQSEQAKTLFS